MDIRHRLLLAADHVRTALSTLTDWLRQSTRPPAWPTVTAMVTVLLCTSYQTLLVARLLFASIPSDGTAYMLTRHWFGALVLAFVVIGAAVVLIWRSRAPLVILLVECALYVAASVAGMHDLLLFPLLFALFSCIARPPMWQIATGLGAIVTAMTVSAWVVTVPGDGGAEYFGQLVTAGSVCALGTAARGMHSWRMVRSSAIEEKRRARVLTLQRDHAISRTRVAAELHDSVGHGLTTIIALAEGIAGTSGDPRTDGALDGINTVARESLDDTRRAVRALADAPHGARTDLASASAADLHEAPEVYAVLDHLRALGVTVVFTETGGRVPDSHQADLCFTVTREAVTNAVRHSRDLKEVVVSWDHGGDGTTIATVRNTDAPPSARETTNASSPTDAVIETQGTGLHHLRARVEECGGTLTFGRSGEAEWTVRAVLVSSTTDDRRPGK